MAIAIVPNRTAELFAAGMSSTGNMLNDMAANTRASMAAKQQAKDKATDRYFKLKDMINSAQQQEEAKQLGADVAKTSQIVYSKEAKKNMLQELQELENDLFDVDDEGNARYNTSIRESYVSPVNAAKVNIDKHLPSVASKAMAQEFGIKDQAAAQAVLQSGQLNGKDLLDYEPYVRTALEVMANGTNEIIKQPFRWRDIYEHYPELKDTHYEQATANRFTILPDTFGLPPKVNTRSMQTPVAQAGTAFPNLVPPNAMPVPSMPNYTIPVPQQQQPFPVRNIKLQFAPNFHEQAIKPRTKRQTIIDQMLGGTYNVFK